MTFMTVEQLQAQIASLTAQNERLQDVMGGFADRIDKKADQIANIFALKDAEIERLREALQTADETLIEINLSNYGMDDVDRLNNSSIEASQIIRAALQPKEGEGC